LKATYWLSSQVKHFSVGEIGFLAHCKTLRLPTNADIEQVIDLKRLEKKDRNILMEYVRHYEKANWQSLKN